MYPTRASAQVSTQNPQIHTCMLDKKTPFRCKNGRVYHTKPRTQNPTCKIQHAKRRNAKSNPDNQSDSSFKSKNLKSRIRSNESIPSYIGRYLNACSDQAIRSFRLSSWGPEIPSSLSSASLNLQLCERSS